MFKRSFESPQVLSGHRPAATISARCVNAIKVPGYIPLGSDCPAGRYLLLLLSAILLVVVPLSDARTLMAAGDPDGITSSSSYPPTDSLEKVRQRIEAAPHSHPRLIANRSQLEALAIRENLSPLQRALAEKVVHEADQLLAEPPITRTLQGRRLLGQSRHFVQRTLSLSLAFYLTGDPNYADRCVQEMLVVARFSDWNPSHFLDVAEMTFGMAIGYDWLYHRLDKSSRDEIRQALIEKGVELPFVSKHKGWVDATNNWGQVCHGGLTAGALAILEDEPDLAARTVHSAIHHVTRSMSAYAPKGSYPEGPGYWSYGTSYNVVLLASLESVLGTDFGLSQAPGFAVTGQYPALMTGPSGLFFNYSDGGDTRTPQSALIWLADRFDRPDWKIGQSELISNYLAGNNRMKNRLLPFALLWLPREEEQIERVDIPLNWNSGSDNPVSVHRSSWRTSNQTFVGFKGGSPSANHGQMDIGSFVLDADGIRWSVDLGAEGYHGIESRGMNLWDRAQDSDRWMIFRQSNLGHSTLVIDGQLQQAAGHGEFIRFSDSPAHSFSILDMSSVYQTQASKVVRGIRLYESGEVLIQDEIDGLTPGSEVEWGMMTQAKKITPAKSRIELRQSNRMLTMHLQEPVNSEWQTRDASRPLHEWDSPNPGTQRVSFTSRAPASGKLLFAVLLTPGSCVRSIVDKLEIRPTSDWER